MAGNRLAGGDLDVKRSSPDKDSAIALLEIVPAAEDIGFGRAHGLNEQAFTFGNKMAAVVVSITKVQAL